MRRKFKKLRLIENLEIQSAVAEVIASQELIIRWCL